VAFIVEFERPLNHVLTFDAWRALIVKRSDTKKPRQNLETVTVGLYPMAKNPVML
jgi:hypothetical protein